MIALLFALVFSWSVHGSGQQEDARPLPELKPFLAKLRKTLRSDSLLLSQYTYTEKETTIEFDSRKRPKKTEVKVYEVFPGVEESQTYRRLVSTNGVPTLPKDLAKQDLENKKDVDSQRRKLEKKSPAELDRDRAKAEREEDEIVEDIFAMYDFQMLHRETLDGHVTVALSFKARPGAKPKTREAKIMRHIAGHAWVSETDHELVRLDMEVMEPISIGLGLLAKLDKGAHLFAERKKVNNEVWLPVRAEAEVSGRLLLFKSLNIREVTEYTDHKKYSVETIIKIPGEKP